LALADFGEARAEEPGEILFLSGKQRTVASTCCRLNFMKFEHNTSISVAMKAFGTEFCKFFCKGSFSKKTQKFEFFQLLATSGRQKSAMITDLQIDGN